MTAKKKTPVKLRICVAVAPTGKYCAFGESNADDAELRTNVLDGTNAGGERIYWLETRVAVPVEGTVMISPLSEEERASLSVAAVAADSATADLIRIIERLSGETVRPADEKEIV